SGVMVTNSLGAGANFSGAALSQGSLVVSNGGMVVWSLGALAGGASANATIVTAPTIAGTIISTASVSANEADLDQANNFAQTTVTSISPNPIVLKGSVTSNQFVLNLTAQAGLPYVFDASTDLTSWTPLYTNTADPAGVVKYVDSPPPGTKYRYYRGRR